MTNALSRRTNAELDARDWLNCILQAEHLQRRTRVANAIVIRHDADVDIHGDHGLEPIRVGYECVGLRAVWTWRSAVTSPAC